MVEDLELLKQDDPNGRRIAWGDDSEPQPARDFGVTDGISDMERTT